MSPKPDQPLEPQPPQSLADLLWSKYVKPRSVTWWASVVPLVVGLTIAFEPIHGLTAVTASLKAAAGMSPAALINLGLAGIGIRGAIR